MGCRRREERHFQGTETLLSDPNTTFEGYCDCRFLLARATLGCFLLLVVYEFVVRWSFVNRRIAFKVQVFNR